MSLVGNPKTADYSKTAKVLTKTQRKELRKLKDISSKKGIPDDIDRLITSYLAPVYEETIHGPVHKNTARKLLHKATRKNRSKGPKSLSRQVNRKSTAPLPSNKKSMSKTKANIRTTLRKHKGKMGNENSY